MIDSNLKNAQNEFLKGNLNKAKKICLDIILNEENSNALNLIGIIELTNKNYLKSINYLNKSLKINPENEKALNNIGRLLIINNKFNFAIKFLDKAITINEKFIPGYLNLSIAYQKINEFDKSVLSLKKILSFDNNSDALNNLGKLYFDNNDHKNSLNYYKKALKINNKNKIILNNIGLLYEKIHQFKKAINSYKAALEIDPLFYDCQFNLSILFLKVGYCKNGIKLYDSRFYKTENRIKTLADIKQLTNKKSFNKKEKLYVISEQGYGDIFQFSRFGIQLKNLGFNATFVVNDELFDFFSLQKVFDHFQKISDFKKIKKCQSIPLLSVPQYFNFKIEDFKLINSYLYCDENLKEHWAKKINKKNFNIGIVWGSKNVYEYDRNIPIKYFSKLLNIDKVRLISLHTKSHNDSVLKKAGLSNKILYFNEIREGVGFGDTAAIIANLDLIISIDTSVAHLSAAMGKKTWILLTYNHDWRWQLKSKKTFWYGNVQLFRSKKENNWQKIFDSIFNKVNNIIGKNEY